MLIADELTYLHEHFPNMPEEETQRPAIVDAGADIALMVEMPANIK